MSWLQSLAVCVRACLYGYMLVCVFPGWWGGWWLIQKPNQLRAFAVCVRLGDKSDLAPQHHRPRRHSLHPCLRGGGWWWAQCSCSVRVLHACMSRLCAFTVDSGWWCSRGARLGSNHAQSVCGCLLLVVCLCVWCGVCVVCVYVCMCVCACVCVV